MANFNKIMLMGNITRDLQLTYLPSNTPIVELGLAVNRKYKRQDGEQIEETMFVDCTAFGKQAEIINQYMTKGSPIFIEGRLKLDRWQDKDGNNRSKHTVVIDNFQFMGSKGGDGGGAPRPQSSNAGGPPAPSEPGPTIDDGDIPF